jgi:uncharacterized protein YjbJ (UPF0337 family)
MPASEEMHMADDIRNDGADKQIEGTADELKGRVRGAVGSLTGNDREQLKGKIEELKGTAKRKIGEAETDADRDI